jgi:hypothetical protein
MLAPAGLDDRDDSVVPPALVNKEVGEEVDRHVNDCEVKVVASTASRAGGPAHGQHASAPLAGRSRDLI